MGQINTMLAGIIPPLVTPLTTDQQLDQPGLELLIERVLAGGVHGLFILGTTGEGPSLSHKMRQDVVKTTCRCVKARKPVLVSVSDTSFDEAVALARQSAECGATAVVIAPPYYSPPSQSELWRWFRRFSETVPLPFYIYNLPGITKVSLGEEVVRRCMDLRNFRGLKDSSGDLLYFKRMQRVLSESGRHSLFIGPEELLLESLLAGGNGGVSGGANVWPSLYVDIYNKARAGDWEAARKTQVRVMDISQRVYSIGGYGATVTKALKSTLSILGICNATMAAPHLAWDEAETASLKHALDSMAIL